MNDLKLGPSTTSKPSKNGSVPRTIEGGVVMALKRLEEWLDAQGRKDAQSGTDDTPFTALHPALRGSHAENKS